MMGLEASEWDALLLSLRVALLAVLLSLPVGIAVAWLLARRDFRGKTLIDMAVHLPLVLPPVVTGYGLLVLFGRQGLIGGWLEATFGISIAFRWTGAVLAGAIVGFPLMVRAIRLSMEAVDQRLESAAATLGAGPGRVFLTLTLPLALPGVITGAFLAFARALGEFGATITFVANIPGETRTLPIAVYTHLQIPGGEQEAIRLVALSVGLAVGALVLSEYLARVAKRRLEPA